MEKTAMQELIDKIKTAIADPNSPEGYTIFDTLADANTFLEKEKQQIIDAYNNGTQQNSPPMEGSQYYNQTYNQQSINEKI